MKVLMVCLGNICRSPLAEGIMSHLSSERQMDVQADSAGTSGWHAGEPPHRESISIARNHGIDILAQRSRKVIPSDLDEFDIVLAMDRSNQENLLKICQNDQQRAKVQLLLSITPEETLDVPDPYFEGGFDKVYRMIYEACNLWLDRWFEKEK